MGLEPGTVDPPTPSWTCGFENCRNGSFPCQQHPIQDWTAELVQDAPAPDVLERLKWPGWR